MMKKKSMKNLIMIFNILVALQLNAQTDFKGKLPIPFEEYHDSLKTAFGVNVYQNVGNDSIILMNKWECFWTIRIYTNGKLILNFEEDVENKEFEIDVFKNSICKFYEGYYIFKIDKRPNTCNSYLIFKRKENEVVKIGVTPMNSAYIFGDVDGDSKLEIGGFEYLFEGDVDSYGTRDKIYKERFRIFEIDNDITRDTELETKFSRAIMSRFDFPHSGITESFVLTKPMNVNEIKEESLRKYAGISVYKLWEGSLDGISKKELRLMRNEVYAAHGYIFKSQDLKEYFSKQLWNEPCCSDVTDKLSEIEKFNVNFIKEKETK